MLYDVETRILIAREHQEALRADAATPARPRRKWFADGYLPRTSKRSRPSSGKVSHVATERT
jgi:hypothetical protein